MEQSNIIKGIIASSGIAIGKVFLIKEDEFSPVAQKIPKESIKKEIARFRKALTEVRNEMLVTKEMILKALGKEHGPLADAYLIMLEDPILNRDVIRTITEQSINAEYALWSTLNRIIQSFARIEDRYFQDRKDDIYELQKRILRRLTGKQKKPISEAEKDAIIIAHSLSPGDTVALREHMVGGFAIDIGGRTSHIAIIAQELSIPAVVGLKNITSQVNDGDTIIIDGNQGMIIVNPDEQVLNNYKREHEIQVQELRELEKLRNLSAQTVDGHRIALACNIESPEDINSVLNSGAEGVGLFRTEFIYLNRDKLPTEDEHYESYRKIVKEMLPYSVTIRTLDLGGDKLSQFSLEGLTPEDNPFLGLRAIRLCLRYPDIFKTQLRAILRASTEGKIKIMFPMISGLDEFLQAKQLLLEAKQELQARKCSFNENIEVGAMIEIPSAALTADIIAQHVDFFSIGTNDLIQYVFAVDRVNENVAFMYEPLHLSVLRIIKNIIDAGLNAGKLVGMCGDMASDPTFTTILIGMGLKELSIPPSSVPKIKKIIRSLSLSKAKDLAREIFSATDRETVAHHLRKAQIKE